MCRGIKMNKEEIQSLKNAAKCVHIAVQSQVADDLADKINKAADTIERLQELVTWMTGCGYDFCQHDYFI